MLAGAAKSSKNSLKDNGHDSHGKVSYAEVQPDTTNPVALQENLGANGAPCQTISNLKEFLHCTASGSKNLLFSRIVAC